MDLLLTDKLISTKEASQLSGYSPDYLARLSKTGKIKSVRVGRNWFLEKDSFEQFVESQGDRKEAYARALARARENEYKKSQSSIRRVVKTLTTPVPLPTFAISRSLRSSAIAIVVAFLVVGSASVLASSSLMQQTGNQIAFELTQIRNGFSTLAQIDEIGFVVSSKEIARSRKSEINISADNFVLPKVSFFLNDAFATNTGEVIASATTPSSEDRHVAVTLSLPTRNDVLNSYLGFLYATGAFGNTLGSALRDFAMQTPRLVGGASLALGSAVVQFAHLAIGSDVALTSGFATAAPQGAEFVVMSLGNAGAALANATTHIPNLVRDRSLAFFDSVTDAAPRIARRIVQGDYLVGEKVVALSESISRFGVHTGDAGIALTRSTVISAQPLALVVQPFANEALTKAGTTLAAVATTAVPSKTISGAQGVALDTYTTINTFLDSTSDALAFFFRPTTVYAPTIVINRPQQIATTTRTVAVSTYPTYKTVVQGVSEDFVAQSIARMRAEILSHVNAQIAPVAGQVNTNITTIQTITRIEDITGLIVREGDFRGGKLVDASNVTTDKFSVTGSEATSTFAGRVDASGGFYINGVAVTAGGAADLASATGVLAIAHGGTGTSTAPSFGQLLLGNAQGGYDLVATSSLGIQSALSFTYPLVNSANTISLAFGTTTANTWSALQQFANASTSKLSVYGPAYFGATATSTFGTDGSLTTPSLTLANITGSTQCLHVDSNGVVSGTGSDCGSSGGGSVTSVKQTYGATQTGAIVLATSSALTFSGLTFGQTITNSGSTFTFTPILSGTLDTTAGGTGLSSVGDGQLVYGSGSTALTALATSTGGFLTNSYATGRPVWSATSTLNIATADLIGTIADNQLASTFLKTIGAGTIGELSYWTGANTLSSIATTTATLGSEFSYSGTLGSLVGGASGNLTLSTNGIALTKLAQIAANSILANVTGATGNVTALATSSLFTWSGTGNVVRDSSPTISAPTFTGLTSLSLASTSQLSVFQKAYFGGTATSSFDSTGALTLATVLTVGNGGTGVNTFTSGQLVYGNGTNALTSVATGTVSSGTGISVTASRSVIGGSLTITNTGVTSVSCSSPLSCSGTGPASFSLGTVGFANGGTATTTYYNNGVVFSDGTKLTQAASSSSFVWNSTLNSLGLGTSTPSAFVSIQGVTPANGSAASTTFAVYGARGGASAGPSGNTGGSIKLIAGNGSSGPTTGGNGGDVLITGGFGGAGPTVGSNGNVLLAIDPTGGAPLGNVGIGTTSPGSLLSIGDTKGINFTTSTTTFNTTDGGINIVRGGCFAINGTCIGGSSFSNTLANGGTGTTTFYSGGVVFSDGTKLTQSASSSNFFWDETNKRLGIATSAPTASLSVGSPDSYSGNGPTGIRGTLFSVASSTLSSFVVAAGTNSASTAFVPFVGIGTTSPWGMLSINPNNLTPGGAFNTPEFVVGSSTATHFVIGGNGNVGIGTSTPMYKLAVVGNAGDSVAFAGNAGEVGTPRVERTLPANLTGHVSVASNGYVYAIGGTTDGSTALATAYYANVQSDGRIGTWNTTTPLPNALIAAGAVVANGYIYVMGGENPPSVQFATVYYAKINPNGTLGAWQLTSSMPATRSDLHPVYAGGYIYVVGGYTNALPHAHAETYYARVNADGTLGTWQTGTSLGTAKYQVLEAVSGGYLYVFGGYDFTSAYATVQSAKINADGSIGSWATLTSLPATRVFSSIVTSNGYVYVIGGSAAGSFAGGVATTYAARFSANGSLYLDPVIGGTWKTLSMPLPSGRTAHTSAVVNGTIYVIGGFNGSATSDGVVTSLPLARTYFGTNIDLIGLASTTLGDPNDSDSLGSVGGSIYAGSIFSNGRLNVTGNAAFANGLGVNGSFTLAATSSAAQDYSIFALMNATSTSPLLTALYNGAVGLGTSTPFANLAIHANNGSPLTTLFAIGSSTASATTTLFSISNAGNVTASGSLTLGSALTVANGGTGTTTAPSGQLLYGGGAGVYQSVATSTFSPNSDFSTTGVIGFFVGGTNSTLTLNMGSAHAWTALQSFSLASTSQLSVFNKAYFGGTATSSFDSTGALTLASALTVGNGGTGVNTFTSGQLVYGNGTNALSSVATTTFTPSAEFTTTGTIGSFVGGANSTLTLATNGVTLTKLAQIAANSILANVTGATGNVTALATSSLGIALSDTTGTLAIARGGTNATSQTTNGVNYFDGTSITSGSQFVFDGTNVGVGTTTPKWNLTISSSTGPQLALTDASASSNPWTFRSTNGAFYLATSSPSTFATSSSAAFAVDTNGVAAISNKLGVGTTSPYIGGLTVDSGTSITNTFLTGSSSSYLQLNIQNRSTGTGASSDLVVTSDNGTESSYYLDLGMNSSTYNQSAYDINSANGGYLYASDGSLALGTASTTNAAAALQFFTGGTRSTNERARFTASGAFGLGTTSPYFALTVSSSTAPQLALTDGSTSANPWTFRSINGAFYLATSSPTSFATSTVAGLAIDTNGKVTVPQLTISGLTGTQCLRETNGIVSGTGSDCGAGSQWTTSGSNIYYTTGNIGVGTTSPLAVLDVAGANNGTAPLFQLSSVTGFATTTRFYVSSTGNVGIGTTTPPGKLAIQTSTDAIQAFTVSNSIGSSTLQADTLDSNGAIFSVATSTGTEYLQVSASGLVGVSSSTPWGLLSVNSSGLSNTVPAFVVGPTTRSDLLVTAGGNVGIGTSTPNWQLQVAGVTPEIALSDMNAAADLKTWLISSNAGNFSIGTSTDVFTESVPPVITILGGSTAATSGNFGIGTSSPAAALSVGNTGGLVKPAFLIGSTTGTNFIVTNFGKAGVGTSTPYGLFSVNAGIGGTTLPYFVVGSSTATNLIVANSGRVGVATSSPWRTLSVVGTVALNGLTASATGNALCITTGKDITDAGGGTCTPSSIRFKENVVTLPIGAAISTLDSLRVVSFDYKPGSYSTEESPSSYGLIAEEVAKIDPTLVDYGYDGQPLTLHFERLTGLTIQAVQELDARTKFIQSVASTTALTVAENGDITAASISGPIEKFVTGSTTLTANIPSEVLSTDGKSVNLYALATFNLANIQALSSRMQTLTLRVDSIEARLAALEVGAGTATSSPFSTTTLTSALASLGVLIEKGIAHFGTVVASQFVANTDANGNSSAGSGTILAGNTVVEITNPLVKATSKIFITFTTPLSGSWYLSEKTDGTFRVSLSAAQTTDASFDYFIVGTEGAADSGTGTTTPAIVPPPAPNVDGGVSGDTSSSTPPTTPPSPVSSDTTPPAITLVGDAAIQLTVGGAWTDSGATATDDTDGDLTNHINVSGTVDSATAGLYTITYSVSDAAGNSAQVSRVVSVVAPEPPAPATPPADSTGGNDTP